MAAQSSKAIESFWVPDDENVFEIGTVIHDRIVKEGSSEQYCQVLVQRETGPEKREYKRSLVYEVDKSHLEDLDDLIEMNSLHEAPLLDILRRRWLQDTMYTFTGEFLVSINPYKMLPGQNDNPLQFLDLTPKKKDAKVTPHVFAVANFALREASKPVVEDEPASVSIIITGESGAGKTEASKQVLNFLTLANKHSFPSDVVLADNVKNVIIDSNAIFEAFGNAKTVRNDNSSRFGKYIKLEYTADNQLWSAHTETFLLEKSRLVSVGTDDRNYHIFYQMVRGLDATSKAKLHLTRVEDYKILTSGGCTVITTEADDINEFTAVCKALVLMGCTPADIDHLWELLSCVLHLGNITVGPAETKKEQLQLASIALEELANILGVDIDGFVTALTMQKVNVKQTGEVYDKILSDEEIRNNIGALIKWVYGGVFNWIVAKVNNAYSTFNTSADKSVVKFIGVLDIFGFEIFANNTFEQLCINYTNERLQQQFNEVVFEAEQEEYRREGLDWTSITFRDNQGVIDLIGKKPKGLLIILEEHSLMNRDPDDLALLNSFNKLHTTAPAMNPFYAKSRFGNDGFVVKHFAGEVSYNIANFIAKNNDSLQEDLTVLFSTSSNTFLLDILRNSEVSAGKDKLVDAGTKIASSVSVSFRFRNQLDTLVSTLRSTKPFYIKCIKPNGEKKAGMFDANLVVTQLRYSGILEIVRIRREGYPTRITYFDFYVEFRELANGKKWIKPQNCDAAQLKEYCRMLCQTHLKTKESYQFGKTFLFLHHYVPGIMSYEVYKVKVRCAIKIQNQMRKLKAKKKVGASKIAAVKVQSLARVFLAKKVKNTLVAEKLQKEEEERQRIEEERLRREEEERRLAEEERARRAAQAADEENRRVQSTKVQKVIRGRKPRLAFNKNMKYVFIYDLLVIF